MAMPNPEGFYDCLKLKQFVQKGYHCHQHPIQPCGVKLAQ